MTDHDVHFAIALGFMLLGYVGGWNSCKKAFRAGLIEPRKTPGPQRGYGHRPHVQIIVPRREGAGYQPVDED